MNFHVSFPKKYVPGEEQNYLYLTWTIFLTVIPVLVRNPLNPMGMKDGYLISDV
jgi:hypothetical protein